MVFMQQLRHFSRIKREACSTILFALDLSDCIHIYVYHGFEIIVCLDTNKNMIRSRIASELKSLCLIETAGVFEYYLAPHTSIRGRHQINAAHTLPSMSRIQAFIFDLPSDLLIGDEFVPFIKPLIIRLTKS